MASPSGLLSRIKRCLETGRGRFSDKRSGLLNDGVLGKGRRVSTPTHLDRSVGEVSTEGLSI